MNYLAIDTSTARASVALAVGKHVSHAEHGTIRDHAQHLLPMVQQLLADAGLSLSQLDGIAFGRGPGSFTGLRIACSVVKGLAYPHDLPLYPVSTLAAIADEVFQSESSEVAVLTMIDARMHEIYWDCYTSDGSHGIEQVTPGSQIVSSTDAPLIFAGIGFETYRSEFNEKIQKQCIKQCAVYPDARAMIRLVQKGQCTPVSVGDALPVYIRNRVVQINQGGSNG
jgi:tRNA threonylcarbamoyladenosine biosynthesis protein TsaB